MPLTPGQAKSRGRKDLFIKGKIQMLYTKTVCALFYAQKFHEDKISGNAKRYGKKNWW